MCVKDTGTKYQLWISDFNIDGTFTRVHPFIISHTKTMTRTREDGKEEVFSACIKPDDTRYLGGNKSSSVVAIKLQGRPRTDIKYSKANEKCYFIGDQANSNNFITEFDFQRGVYFIPNLVGTNKKFDYNYIRGNNGQDTDKSVRVLLVGGSADDGSWAGSGFFYSGWAQSGSSADVGFFTTVKLD
ncbi:MAG: hypothetical protein [Bacteriophage sp.]|nr:MAG: hypothetical protein [Bacteriophage sp.]